MNHRSNNQKTFKCTVGVFTIGESFAIADMLFEKNYEAVSCVEDGDNRWFVEVLSTVPIREFEIAADLEDYKYNFFKSELLEETDWLKKCFENFKPIVVGKFFVYGPHLRMKPRPADKITIEIAAATAFGTGEHPTTSRCLLACQTFFDNKIHKNVLDIGCGSGILGIALAKLGARNIVACDNDSEAVRITKENIEINRVAHYFNVFENKNGNSTFPKSQYDFITANILAEPLISMAENVFNALNDNGILVVSGFNSNDKSVEKKYKSLGLKKKYEYEYKDWSTIVFEKQRRYRKKYCVNRFISASNYSISR